MKHVPEEWPLVVETLRDLVTRCGADTFVSAPLLLPALEFFPDQLPPGGRGARRLVRRLMAHAGLHDVPVHLEVHAADSWEGRSPLQFTGLDERGAAFELYGQHPWEELLGFACFEVALAFRAVRHLDGTNTPYRGRVEAHDEEVWQLAAVTAVYLGFGVLGLDASHRYEASGEQHGYVSVTQWRHSFAGGLPLHALAWTLGLQVTLRGSHDPSGERVLAALRPNQRASYQQALTELRPERDRHVDALGLPPPERWPALRPVDSTRLGDDEEDAELALREAEHAAQAKARRSLGATYRVAEKRGVVMMPMLGLLTLPLVPAIVSVKTESGAVVWGSTAVALLALYLFYRALGYSYRCSTTDCWHSLTLQAVTCPGCKLPIVGDVRAGKDELDLPRAGDDEDDGEWDGEAP